MATLLEQIEGERSERHRPWPRVVVTEDGWRFVGSQLSTGYWTLLALWGDAADVHMAVLDETAREIAVVTISCPGGRFPSVGVLHPPAIRLERALRDLYGIEPVGLPDTRPWLDLGFWDLQHPLGGRSQAPPPRAPYVFLPVQGESRTRSRSVPCTPASSSQGTSASPPAARQWCGWKSASATCTRASRG